eukprot:402983_1
MSLRCVLLWLAFIYAPPIYLSYIVAVVANIVDGFVVHNFVVHNVVVRIADNSVDTFYFADNSYSDCIVLDSVYLCVVICMLLPLIQMLLCPPLSAWPSLVSVWIALSLSL